MIEKGYLDRMKSIGLFLDTSFVLEADNDVFLVSYYGFGEVSSAAFDENQEIEGMKEYQELLSQFFNDEKPFADLAPANSFKTI